MKGDHALLVALAVIVAVLAYEADHGILALAAMVVAVVGSGLRLR